MCKVCVFEILYIRGPTLREVMVVLDESREVLDFMRSIDRILILKTKTETNKNIASPSISRNSSL